jgi:hypothetical protein
MSGWIKFEKDLASDPRVLRMAKELGRCWFFAPADTCVDGVINARNAEALPGVTLVCGALARLWIYADSHAREDDTLDLGPLEIDELLGIPGFCAMMPPDWLVQVGENTVELPGFQAHNGVEAKKRALTQKRVERHRETKKHESVTPRNASSLPDQDQTKTNKTSMSVAPTEVVEVFDHWKVTHGHDKATLDAKRIKLIRNALKLQPSDVLKRSISGYKNSPHHMGQNERQTVYDDIELFLRDAKHIDAGLKFFDKGSATQWQ